MGEIFIPELKEIKVGLDGNKVVLYTKSAIIKMPWQVVKTVVRAMQVQAGRAEELANLPRLLDDQAFMFRSGAPFGLSNDPDILKEAAHIAQYDDTLRRHLPGGVKSKAVVGTPRVIKHPPKKEGNNGKEI